jgi:hypothetical protein
MIQGTYASKKLVKGDDFWRRWRTIYEERTVVSVDSCGGVHRRVRYTVPGSTVVFSCSLRAWEQWGGHPVGDRK